MNEAEQLEIQVLDMRKTLLGAEHTDTLTSMTNLASTYCQQGKLNEAEHLMAEVLDISLSEKLLGAKHPITLLTITLTNLASIYCDQGKLDEAEQLGIQVLGISKKQLGAGHPTILSSIDCLESGPGPHGPGSGPDQPHRSKCLGQREGGLDPIL